MGGVILNNKSEQKNIDNEDILISNYPEHENHLNPITHSLRKNRCSYDKHNFTWFNGLFKCTYCYTTRKYGLNCELCDTYLCFDCNTGDFQFQFNTHFCPRGHKLINSKKFSECNRCLSFKDGYECLGCKYFICTGDLCRGVNSTNQQYLPVIKGIISSYIGHVEEVLCLLSYSDKILASGGKDGTIKLWDIESGVCYDTLLLEGEVVCLIKHKNCILSLSNNIFKKWENNKGWWSFSCTLSHSLKNESHTFTNMIMYNSDNTMPYIIFCDKNNIEAYIYDTSGLVKHKNQISLCSQNLNFILPDEVNKKIYLSLNDNLIRVYEIEIEFKAVFNLKGHDNYINNLVIFENKLFSSSENVIKIWDLKNINQNSTCIESIEFTFKIEKLIIDYNTFIMTSRGDSQISNQINIFDLKSMKIYKNTIGHEKEIESIIFYNKFTFFSCGRDKTIKLWFISNNV